MSLHWSFEVRNPLVDIVKSRRRHRRDNLKILWDARDLVLEPEEFERRLTIFVVRFYRDHRKIRPIILLYQNRR